MRKVELTRNSEGRVIFWSFGAESRWSSPQNQWSGLFFIVLAEFHKEARRLPFTINSLKFSFLSLHRKIFGLTKHYQNSITKNFANRSHKKIYCGLKKLLLHRKKTMINLDYFSSIYKLLGNEIVVKDNSAVGECAALTRDVRGSNPSVRLALFSVKSPFLKLQ